MGLDAGGGGGRCLLAVADGSAVTTASRRWTHPAAAGGGLGVDLDLELIWRRLAEATREVMARTCTAAGEVLGVAVASMRFSVVVVDGDGRPIYAGPNRDARAAAEGVRLAADHGAEIHERTGHWPLPIFAAPRLCWLANTHPEAWRRARAFLCLGDWLNYRLTGEIATDRSQAGESGLLDLESGEWAFDLAERLGLPRAIFPPLRESGSRIGSLTSESAEALGLLAGTPVSIGGADTQCGLLGAGATAPGALAAIAGTTAPVQLVMDRPRVDPEARLWTGHHVVSGLYVAESNAGPTGEALEWFARLLFDTPLPVARLLAEAACSEPGAGGMLSTLGADVMDARSMGPPVANLTLSHLLATDLSQDRAHLARAVVEGTAYALRANIEQLRQLGGKGGEETGRLRVGGGLSRSAVWTGIVCDVLEAPVEVSRVAETSALGAAICAGVGAGAFGDLPEAASTLARPERTHEPEAGRAGAYRRHYASWCDLRASRSESDRLAGNLALQSLLGRTAETPPREAPRARILVTADLDPDGLDALRELGRVEYASFREKRRLLTGPSLVSALRDVDVFITEVDVVDVDALAELPELRVIAACRGDAVNVDAAACTAFGIPLLHAHGRNADAVADLTLTFLLMLARKLPEAAAFLRQPGIEAGDLGRMGQAFQELRGRELRGKTVGLVGLGAVGQATARRLGGFGVEVLAYDPSVDADSAVRVGAEPVGLDELLERSDFVSLHAAVTDTSRGMIGARELARMRPGACLVNTARAALVDEDALADALRSGQLSGAALDVFRVEPPGSQHPLLELPNVIATPHVGGNTQEVPAHQGRIIADALGRLLRGERVPEVLNPEVLAHFAWERPRPLPDPSVVSALRAHPGPAVSDLQQAAEPSGVSAPGGPAADPEVTAKLERILGRFVDRVTADDELRSFAEGKSVTLQFAIRDVGLGFWLRLGEGRITGALGAPDARAEVDLRMSADVLDGMFTGRVNPMDAAMRGELSFTGDAAKAMTLQHMQDDLQRIYTAVRTEIGDPGDLSGIPRPRAPSPAASGDDLRLQIVATVTELYAQQLITATGGNVSARIPGSDELWITPSQMFKGGLTPEALVRIDLEGRPLDADARSPSSERLMHCAVFRVRPDAQAVIHAHAAHATILANSGLPFLPISTEAAFFGDIPRIPFIMPGTEALALAIAKAARKSWAVLMQNHGLLVAGRSLRRAADMAEIIERTAQVILGCYAVGKEPPTLPDDVVETLRKMGDLVA